MSSQEKRQSRNGSLKTSVDTRLFQSWRPGLKSGLDNSAIQLISANPFSGPEMG